MNDYLAIVFAILVVLVAYLDYRLTVRRERRAAMKRHPSQAFKTAREDQTGVSWEDR